MEHRLRIEQVFVDGGSFELSDDERLLDAELATPNRVRVAIATPVEAEAEQCQWTLDSGERCQRDRTAGSEYCWQHE